MERLKPETPIRRRTFLKGALAAVALALIPPLRVLEDPAARSGIQAALSRPDIETPSNPNLETRNVSDAMLEKTWEKHFEPRKDLMTLEAWKKQGGVGRNIAILANLYYDREKLEKESFDLFYERFIDKIHQASDMVDLDFIVLTSTLQMSGENMGSLKKQAIDIKEEHVRTGVVPVMRALNLEEALLNGITRGNPELLHIRNALQKQDPSTSDEGQNGIWPYNLVRVEGQPTIGMMDFEPEKRAEAFTTAANKKAQDFLKTHYADVASSYKHTLEKRNHVEIARKQIEGLTDTYIGEHGETIDIFLQPNRDHLAAIGLKNDLSVWQRANFTQAWVEAVQVMDDGQSIIPSLVNHMQQEREQDPKRFYKNFISQQLRNPLFLPYLIDYARQKGDQQQATKLTKLQEKMKEYEQKTEDLRVALYDTLKEEGPHEYDSDFQVLTSAITTKMLSEQAGDFNPHDKNSLYWHIYRTCAIREMASPYVLANDSLFLRGSLDNPYAPSAMISHVDEFTKLLRQKRFISKPPEEDAASYINAIHFFRFSRNKAKYPQVYQQDVDELTRYFEKYLVTRVYINPIGLGKMEKMSWFKPLINLLNEKGMLKKPPREDLARFYKVTDDLLQNSLASYPQLTEGDRQQINDYVTSDIRPSLKSTTPEGEQESLHYAEYPPIVRAQGVVGRNLMGLNV